MFSENERVQEELGQVKPKQRAVELLMRVKSKLTLEAHLAEVDSAITHVQAL